MILKEEELISNITKIRNKSGEVTNLLKIKVIADIIKQDDDFDVSYVLVIYIGLVKLYEAEYKSITVVKNRYNKLISEVKEFGYKILYKNLPLKACKTLDNKVNGKPLFVELED